MFTPLNLLNYVRVLLDDWTFNNPKPNDYQRGKVFISHRRPRRKRGWISKLVIEVLWIK